MVSFFVLIASFKIKCSPMQRAYANAPAPLFAQEDLMIMHRFAAQHACAPGHACTVCSKPGEAYQPSMGGAR